MKKTLVAAIALLTAACSSPPAPPPPAPPPPPPPPAAAPVPTKIDAEMMGAQLAIKTDIEFDTGKATIRHTEQTEKTLGAVLAILQRVPQIGLLRIEGHTDSDGSAMDNEKLSLDRAHNVRAWLIQHGVAEGRLKEWGCGARDPLAPNDSPEHKQRNRRTEFDVELVGGQHPEGWTEACVANKFRH